MTVTIKYSGYLKTGQHRMYIRTEKIHKGLRDECMHILTFIYTVHSNQGYEDLVKENLLNYFPDKIFGTSLYTISIKPEIAPHSDMSLCVRTTYSDMLGSTISKYHIAGKFGRRKFG